MRIVATVLSLALSLVLIGAPVIGANPKAGQCEPGLYKIDTSDGSIVFPLGWQVCLKASNGNTGRITTDGTTTIAEYIEQSGLRNNGGQIPNISNYVVYAEGRGDTPIDLPVEPKEPKGPGSPDVEPQPKIGTSNIVNPWANFYGPKGDPWFRYVLNNSRSTRPVTFIVEPFGRKITVPGGCIWRSGWQYVKPYTDLTIKRGNGTILARENSGPGGYYGKLFKGYVKGGSCKVWHKVLTY